MDVVIIIEQIPQSMPNISAPSLHPITTKQQPPQQVQQQVQQQPQQVQQQTQQPQQQQQQQQKFYQPLGNQILSPSSTSSQSNFSPVSGTSPPLQSTTGQQTIVHQTPAQPPPPTLQPPTSSIQQQTTIGTQQSTQCQTDPPDIKPNIQLLSPIKQELQSPLQIQAQSGSPAGQVVSPRVVGKCPTIQSPVNVAVSPSSKQIISPGNVTGPIVSPRQGVKRPATSPICRQINRSDL